MRSSSCVSWVIALCTLAVACSKSPPTAATQIVVAITSNLTLETELSRIEIKISKRDGSDALPTQKLTLVAKSPKSGEATLPVTFAIGKGKESSFLLVVTGYGPLGAGGAEEKVVEQRAIATFQDGKTLLLQVFLGRVCLKQLCGGDDTKVCYLKDTGAVKAGECGDVVPLGKGDLTPVPDPGKLPKIVPPGSGGTGGEGPSGKGGQSSGGTGGGTSGNPQTGGNGGGGGDQTAGSGGSPGTGGSGGGSGGETAGSGGNPATGGSGGSGPPPGVWDQTNWDESLWQ